MRKLANLILSASIILTCAVISLAQRGRVSTEARDRIRETQRIIENTPNPAEIELAESSVPKPKPQPVAAPVRAIVDLEVVGITDGDTLIISNTAGQQLRLRLQGIDAPEAGQSFNREAQASLAKLVSGKRVTVEFDPRGRPDSEGRIVAKIYLEGRDIALEQIRAGFAWFCKDYKKEQTESDRYTYAEAEKEARTAGRGLWKESAPLSPWKFRAAQ